MSVELKKIELFLGILLAVEMLVFEEQLNDWVLIVGSILVMASIFLGVKR